MSVAELIFGKLRAAQTDQRTGSWPRYREILIEAATGNPDNVDPFEVESVCEALNKSEKDFSKDVETMRDRLRWADELKTGKDAQARMDKAEQDIKQLDAEFEKARQKHMQAWPALDAARQKAMRDQSAATRAAADLRRTCISPDVLLKQKQLRDRSKPIGKKLQSLREQLDPNKSRNRGDGVISVAHRLGLLQQEAAHAKKHKEQPRAETLAAIKETEQQLRDIKTRIAELEAESARLDAEHADLNDARLIP